MPEHDRPGILSVHVVNAADLMPPREPPKVAPRKHSVFNTVTADGTATAPVAFRLLAAAPDRIGATLYLSGGNAGDVVRVTGDAGSASNNMGGAVIPVTSFPVPIEGTDDVWLTVPAGKIITVGVIAVYQATGAR
jgi:hypothetical protein